MGDQVISKKAGLGAYEETLAPEAYLLAVIGQIAEHPINRIHELLTWEIKLR